MSDMSKQEFNPGPGPEHFKKFQIKSESRTPDIRMQLGSNQDDMESIGPEEYLKYLFGVGGERLQYTEMAEQVDPAKVRHETRMFSAVNLINWHEFRKSPNDYLIDYNILPSLISRVNKLRISKPLGLEDYSDKEKRAGLDKPRTEESPDAVRDRRNSLIREYESSAKEVRALQEVISSTQEQDLWSVDVEKYMIDRFLRLGKSLLESGHYRTILNLPSSYENKEKNIEFEPFGEKIEKAFNAWVEVAEGRAIVELEVQKEDGTKVKEPRVLPNIFAMPRNRGLEALSIDYVANRIGYTFNPQKSDLELNEEEGAIKSFEKFDNRVATLGGLLLFRHWDFDAYYGLGTQGFRRNVGPKAISPEDISNLSLEITFGDVTKAILFEGRRLSEWTGFKEKHRDHPRPVGSPATLGCYPMLTSHALDLMTIEVLGKNKDHPDETQKIGISIYNSVYGNGEAQRERQEKSIYGKENNLVTWTYNKARRLGDDGIWDNITVLDGGKVINKGDIVYSNLSESERAAKLSGAKGKVLEVALGTPTFADNVPVGLQQYYAGKDLYVNFMRTDFNRLYEEILGGHFLRGMNKGIDVALGIMATGQNIDKKTLAKLNDYIRITFLGGTAAAIIKSVGSGSIPRGDTMERWNQVPGGKDKEVVASMESAALITGFVRVKEPIGDRLDWDDTKHKDLYDRIIKERKAPTPFELEGTFFTTEELRKIKPLYPLADWP